MRNKKLSYGILVAVLLVLGLWLLVFHQSKSSFASACGIESCHGLEITCGSNVPVVCTELYMLGDRCRQYAACEVINGKCQLAKSEKFDRCKSCVEKCTEEFKDNIEIWQCESKCGEN